MTTMPPTLHELQRLQCEGERRVRVTAWLLRTTVACYGIGGMLIGVTLVVMWASQYPWWPFALCAVGLIALSEWLDHVIEQRIADEHAYITVLTQKTLAFLRDTASQHSTEDPAHVEHS